MTDRSDVAPLRLVHAAERAYDAALGRPTGGEVTARRVFGAMRSGDLRPAETTVGGTRPPACAYLDSALETAGDHGGAVGEIAQALRSVATELGWERRPDVEGQAADFAQGHANAIFARSQDAEGEAVVGISLMAPAIRYPDHHHPPDEVYIVLSPGEWRQNEDEWHEPGVGGVVHNPSGIVHAMQSGDAPLLALWLHFRHHVGA